MPASIQRSGVSQKELLLTGRGESLDIWKVHRNSTHPHVQSNQLTCPSGTGVLDNDSKDAFGKLSRRK